MAQEIRVLVLEDLEADALLAIHELSKAGIVFDWKRVETENAFLQALQEYHPHVILADYSLPKYDGRSALRHTRTVKPDIPFVFVTGTLGEELAIELLKEGATDYVLKSGLSRLGPAVQRGLREHADYLKRREIEDAHRVALERYRQVIENATDIVFTTDREGNFIYSNEAGIRTSGYSMGELWSLNYLDLVIPSHRKRLVRHFYRQIISNTASTSVEFPFQTKSGEVRWFSMNAALVHENGVHTGFHMIAREVTKRKLAENALKESEERFRTLFRANPAAIELGKLDTGILIDVNDRYCEFFGYSRDEVIGKSAIDLVLYAHPEERSSFIKEIERKGVVQNHETVFRRKSGELRDALLSMSVINVLGESILISMIVDITDRKRVLSALERSEEQYRKSSEQLRALAARLQSSREDEQTRIAREIHDELGQALTGLKMDLVWVERKWNAKSHAVALEKMRGMHGLIDEIVRMVRRISSELRPGALDDLGLVAALEWQLGEFSERTSIRGAFHSERDNYELDREMSTAIFRIFQESLTNIARHSGASEVEVRLRTEQRALVLEVQDNGRGITQPEIAQTTSLGLLGMRERAFVFNGSVDISGTTGAGTTLTVRIPWHPEERRNHVPRTRG
ncbi:MAG: PAS domain S-box protein [Bacteroidota bacterium]